jgi:hypothetical protein
LPPGPYRLTVHAGGLVPAFDQQLELSMQERRDLGEIRLLGH